MSKADDLRAQREAAQVAYEKASKSSRGGGQVADPRRQAVKQTGECRIEPAQRANKSGVGEDTTTPRAGVASGPREYKSGGGPEPSTLTVDLCPSPSVSRRGGPDYKCPVCEARRVAHRLRAAKSRAKKAAK